MSPRPFYSRQQAARTRTGRTPAELATEEACKAYLDQLSAPLAGRSDAAAAAAVPALVASTAATPVPVDDAAAVAHTAAVAHSPPPQSSRLELAAASVAAVAAATAAAAAAAAATAIPAATAIAAANTDGPDGPASQDAHPTMRRHLVPSGAPAPAPTTAVRALFAMPNTPMDATGVRTASALPPAGVPLATAPLLSNADGDGNREARHFGLDAVFCCCRKDQAAPVAEVSEYAPPDPPQEICRG